MAGARDSITIVVPWYEPDDFMLLSKLAVDEQQLQPSYGEWASQATAAVERLLSEGKIVQLVTVKSGDYLAWLEEHGRENSRLSRRRYLRKVAGSVGGKYTVLRDASGRDLLKHHGHATNSGQS
jgi:hypothetical protein